MVFCVTTSIAIRVERNGRMSILSFDTNIPVTIVQRKIADEVRHQGSQSVKP